MTQFGGLLDLEADIVVAIIRIELDAAVLRRAAARSRDADAAQRMLDGHNRTEAAALCGMDRQTLRD